MLEVIGVCRCNILILGGIGFGKIMLLNCLIGFIEEDEWVIMVEDVVEL